ncbi:MAG: AMP-binding protein [Clostridia bacterium]|nr:AMP-binding protein [Clostridia bacterium]
MTRMNYPLYETTEFENIRIMVENAANRFPDRIAYSYKTDPRDAATVDVTFAAARDRIRDIGTGLASLGLAGRHVALVGENSYDWICSYFALMAIGSVVVPVDKDMPAEDIADILRTADCAGLLYGAAAESKAAVCQDRVPSLEILVCMGKPGLDGAIPLDRVASQGREAFLAGDNGYYDRTIDPDRLATIVFTSGTTGKGKGVMLSQRNISLDMTNGMYYFQITPRTICTLPLHHTFGSTVILVGHFSQGATVYISSGLRYIGAEIREIQPSHLVLVPLFLEKLHARIWSGAEEQGKAGALRVLIRISNVLRKVGIDLRRILFKSVLAQLGGRLEMVISGGAALRQDIIDTFDGIGVTLLNGYGITECAPLVSCNRNRFQKSGSVGLPIKDEQVRILDPDENGEGEICVKGPNVMMGYYKDPEATAAAFDADGFFRTGDYGRLDADGWLYITGRLKNLIILSNGKNVYPEEIENELARIPGVGEVVVYAGESAAQNSREAIVAEIWPDADKLRSLGITDAQEYFNAEVRKVNARMVSYKAVNLVKLRAEEFPKNTTKKIQRFHIDKRID